MSGFRLPLTAARILLPLGPRKHLSGNSQPAGKNSEKAFSNFPLGWPTGCAEWATVPAASSQAARRCAPKRHSDRLDRRNESRHRNGRPGAGEMNAARRASTGSSGRAEPLLHPRLGGRNSLPPKAPGSVVPPSGRGRAVDRLRPARRRRRSLPSAPGRAQQNFAAPDSDAAPPACRRPGAAVPAATACPRTGRPGAGPECALHVGRTVVGTVTVPDNDTPPSAPYDLAATPGNTEVRLWWEPPLEDHGQPKAAVSILRVGVGVE